MIHIIITFGDRCRKIAKPTSYKDLIAKARKEFPMMSSVACLVVMYYPKTADETIIGVKMVELDSNAYGSVKAGDVLFFNVQHPITKEYILPYPGEDPDVPRQSQYHPADVEIILAGAGEEKQQHVKVRPNSFLERPHVYEDASRFSAEIQQAGGDAFGSGWGAASDRFWRSTKLVPDLKECRDAISLSIGASNGYPDDQSADDWNKATAAELQAARTKLDGAFDSLSGGTPMWLGATATGQRSQKTDTSSAGGAGWANSGIGAETQGWGHRCASGHRDSRHASPRTVDMGPDITSSGTELGKALSTVNDIVDHQPHDLEETDQFPQYDDPLQNPPPHPSRLNAGRAAPSTDNSNNSRGIQAVRQNERIGNDAHNLRSRPVHHPMTAPSEPMKYNYGRPNGRSLQQLVRPGATGSIHLVPLELQEREAAIQKVKQAAQHRCMVRDSTPISESRSSFFDPAKLVRDPPARELSRSEGKASSQWATKEVRHKANKAGAQNRPS
ncbi:hypothetical protein N0V82_003178 [Gnomoniopsis sp. IMI 355080]|nr:hypothetical protein N0V82_003178 [Gnomoniopsis sp. IMI 355080]